MGYHADLWGTRAGEYKQLFELDVTTTDWRQLKTGQTLSSNPLINSYSEKYSFAARMRKLADTYYSPVACIYHYLHMAQGNYRQYLKGERVWIKKYFYVLRPILAINWIEQGYGVAPTAFGSLLERVVTPVALKSEIQKLIELKRTGAELDYGPRISVISDFIESELGRLEHQKSNYRSNATPYEELDTIFQEGLEEAWQ